ncbi:DNA primase [subsurface metagenome]
MIDLDQLKQAIRIDDLARQLGLQVRGRQARCFNVAMHKHQDRNPSLGFDLKTNRFKCFACGVSGSIIDLYIGVKKVGLKQAINDLAQMAGFTDNPRPLKRKEDISREVNKPIPEQTGAITKGIYKTLQDYCGELDQKSLAYLTGATRGLKKETISHYRLFSIKDYPATNKFMQEKFNLGQLKQAGLVSEKGNLIFYEHKIVIPFYNNGRIIYLQGRRADDQQPRYLQIKRPVPLFNADILKEIAPGSKIYICEGVFDAMLLAQEGYKAVAILGVNNFKPEKAGLFKGFEVVLCLDNDESGKLATQALARIFLLQGQKVKTKRLPDGIKDITEYFIKGVRQ